MDITRDTNFQTLHKIRKLVDMPAYVKESAITAASTQVAVADPTNNSFPVHTKAATWLSQAYFSVAGADQYSTTKAAFVQGRLNRAAKFWSIEPDCDIIKSAMAKTTTVPLDQLPDNSFALVFDFIPPGQKQASKQRLFPLIDAESIKKSAANLWDYRDTIPFSFRRTAARNLLKAAQQHQVDFDNDLYLDKAAGFGISMPKKVAELIAQRVNLAPNTHHDLRIKMAQMAKDIQDIVPSVEVMNKLAEIIDQFDMATGLFNQYKKGLPMPEQVCFDFTEKESALVSSEYVRLTTGDAYPINDFLNIPLNKYAGVMGSDFANEIADATGFSLDLEKLAAVVPTLPLNDALMLKTLMEA